MSQRRAWVAAALFALVMPVAVAAQQTGTVAGRVISTVGEPVSGATVRLVGTTRGTIAGQDGSFRVAAVPVGSYQVRVTRIGFAPETQSTTVTAGQTAELTFRLTESATIIDEVVVTATGETQRRRESGTATSTIPISQVDLPATPSIAAMLTARAPGLLVQTSGGTTGTSSRLRIRGSNSINLSNEPLIIVDGIRVNNSPASMGVGVGGQTISRLEDFNPEDLESVEVIKGPAAAALYGTAAANGVIQVTTKRGRVGRTRWNAYEEFGSVKDVGSYPDNMHRVGTVVATGNPTHLCTLEREVLNICVPKNDSILSWNPIMNVSPFRNGWRQTHGLNTAGGGDMATFYIGGELEREQGVYEPNKLRRVSGRSNLHLQVRPDLDALVNFGYLRNNIRLPFNDNTAFGAISAGLLGKGFDCSPTTRPQMLPYCGADSLSRGYFNANIPSSQYYAIESLQGNDRLTAGLTTNWTPLTWLRGVGVMGFDLINRTDEAFTPPNTIFFSATTLEGSRTVIRVRLPSYSLSGTLTSNYAIRWMDRLLGETSVGTQFNREEFRSNSSSGAVVLPGTKSLNGTSARFSVAETNQQVVTLGWLARQQFAYDDRLFVTLALRQDRGSTFGSEFGAISYPAVNFSWVISDEAFFPQSDFLSQLRLRAGWGRSGQRPNFREATTFLSPVSVRIATSDVAAVIVGGTGNSLLKPERTEELEGGFEASLFNDRIGLEVTGYTKTTSDAIIARVLAPSLGASVTQLDNIGEVSNRGIELLGRATVLNVRDVRLESTVSFATNHNKLITLGEDIAPILFGFGSTQNHREGYPLGGYFKRKIVSYEDLDGNGILTRINCPAYGGTANPQMVGGPRCEMVLSDSVEYLGSPFPTHEVAFMNVLNLTRFARLSALLNYRGGYKLFNSTEEFRCTGVSNCPAVYDRTVGLEEQAKVVARLMGSEVGYIEDASFWKLREVALTLDAPRRWTERARLAGLSVTLAGRNLATWTDYTGLDPEVNSNSGFNFTTSDFLAQPPVRYFVTRVNVNF